MKRKIALLLALVMVLSMVPMMSFAASDNEISNVPTVKEDHEFNINNAPRFTFEEKNGDWKRNAGQQTFRLKLENAEWLREIEKYEVDSRTIKYDGVTDSVYGVASGIDTLTISRNSSTSVTVEVKRTPGFVGDAIFNIPMLTEITDSGDVTVTVESRDSGITSGTYTFARSGDGKALASIDGDVTLSDKAKDLKTIEIDETNPGAYRGGEIKFKLSSGFIWAADSGKSIKQTVIDAIDFGGGYVGSSKPTASEIDIDEETLTIDFNNLRDTANGSRGTIFISGLFIDAEMDAKHGEVTMRVSGRDIETTDLLVAKYKDYDVIVKADGDANELIAGKFESGKTDEAHELQKLVIKEDIKGSLLDNRKVEIELPSWVKIRNIQVPTAKKINLNPDNDFRYDRAGNKVEFTVNKTNGDKVEIELEIYVSVEADATGDITALVSGKALGEEHEILLGKAIAPVEVTTDVKDVRIGVQKQELGKITLTENMAGAFKKGGDVVVKLDSDTRWTEDPVVKVVDGEGLKIDRVKTKDEVLSFRVVRESDKPATIEISGGEVDLYRTLPEGNLKVFVGGDALVENANEGYYNYPVDGIGSLNALQPASTGDRVQFDYATFKTDWVAEPVIAKVVTPADKDTVTTKEVVLTIGSTTMFVDGVSETANAAPYIDSKDRTMLPVSAIGRALGAKVEWNDAARTVLVTKGNDRVLLTIGSDTMNVNGMNIPMRSKAVITNERTFVPLKDLGVALGVNVEWDAATRTVTIK